MTYLAQLRKSNDDQQRIILLPLAISEKIDQLSNDLKTYPGFFFELPGVASIREKKGKIQALNDLQIRIVLSLHQDDVPDYAENILDGITLELYKIAAELYPTKFYAEEIHNLNHRNTGYRLLRWLTLIDV